MGIIDTLSAGFGTTAKKLWLIILPVLLDIFLWLGPKLSIAPVIDKMVTFFREGMRFAAPTTVDASVAEMFDTTLEAFRETMGRLNWFAFLAWGRLGVPSVAGFTPIDAKTDHVIAVSEYWQLLLLQIVIMAAGLLLAALFLVILGSHARGGGVNWHTLFAKVLRAWVYMAIVFVPLGFFLLFGLSFSLLLGPLSIFAGVFFLWLLIYMTFVPQAIALGEENPLHAVLSSFTIVRLNFWATLGLIILVNVISTGLGLVWYRVFMRTAVGTLVAIVANAYVGTSLTLAMFIFYRDRVALWRELLRQRSV